MCLLEVEGAAGGGQGWLAGPIPRLAGHARPPVASSPAPPSYRRAQDTEAVVQQLVALGIIVPTSDLVRGLPRGGAAGAQRGASCANRDCAMLRSAYRAARPQHRSPCFPPPSPPRQLSIRRSIAYFINNVSRQAQQGEAVAVSAWDGRGRRAAARAGQWQAALALPSPLTPAHLPACMLNRLPCTFSFRLSITPAPPAAMRSLSCPHLPPASLLDARLPPTHPSAAVHWGGPVCDCGGSALPLPRPIHICAPRIRHAGGVCVGGRVLRGGCGVAVRLWLGGRRAVLGTGRSDRAAPLLMQALLLISHLPTIASRLSPLPGCRESARLWTRTSSSL